MVFCENGMDIIKADSEEIRSTLLFIYGLSKPAFSVVLYYHLSKSS